MKRMLQIEGFRFCNTRSLWAILAVLTLCAGFSVISGVYGSAEDVLNSLRGDNILLMFSAAVYSGLMLTDDFSNGMMRRYIVSGQKRKTIILAKFTHYMVGCTVLLLLYPLIPVILAAATQGVTTSFSAILQTLMSDFICIWPLYLGVSSLFFFIAVAIQKGAVTIGTSIAVTAVITVLTNNLYGNGQTAASPFLKFSPVFQIKDVVQTGAVTNEYILSAIFSVGILIIFMLLGILRVKRQEF